MIYCTVYPLPDKHPYLKRGWHAHRFSSNVFGGLFIKKRGWYNRAGRGDLKKGWILRVFIDGRQVHCPALLPRVYTSYSKALKAACLADTLLTSAPWPF